MLLDRSHQILASVASKDFSRPVLSGIHVMPDYAEAADGFMMLRLPRAHTGGYGEPKARGKPIKKRSGIILPAKAVKEALRALPKRGRGDTPAHEVMAVGRRNGAGVLSTLTSTAEIPAITGTFPKVSPLIPKRVVHGEESGTATVYTMALAPACLAIIAKAAKDLGAIAVRFQTTSPSAPVRLDFVDADNADVYGPPVGVVMPMAIHADKPRA